MPNATFATAMADTLLENVRILDPHSGTDTVGHALVVAGVLQSFGTGRPAELPAGVQRINAQGLWLTPGWVDIHTHFREPGFEWKEDIASASRAAARGGITAAVCMANTNPVNDTPPVTKTIIDRGREVGLIDLRPVGACTVGLKGEELASLVQLAQAGCVAFSDDGHVIQNGHVMRRVLEFARSLDLPVVVHAEDNLIRQGGAMHEGAISWQLGYRGNPRTAESVMVARDIELAALTGGHVHIQHVSTADAVMHIRRAKERGLPVTAEGCPHHFTLTDEAVLHYGTNAKMAPPLREQRDVDAITAALVDGTFDCIATDHAPHAPHEKELPFEDAPFGILGFQTLVPLTLALGARTGMPQLRLIDLVTRAAAALMRMPHGQLTVGAPAEFTLIDPKAQWVLDASTNESKSRNSPWWGQSLTGKAIATAYNGRWSFSELQ